MYNQMERQYHAEEYQTRKTNGSKRPNQTVISVGKVDQIALLIIILLLLTGIVMIFSAAYFKTADTDIFKFLKLQSAFAVMGFCIMIFMSNFNYRYLMRFVVPLYLVSNALLIVVLFVGNKVGGGTRWIPIFGFQFQPSEVSKIAVILMLSYIINNNKNILKTWFGFMLCCSTFGVTAGLVLSGNSMSMAIIISIIGFGMIFVASPYIMRFLFLGVSAIAGLILYLTVLAKNFRSDRIEAWLDPFANPLGYGYQIIQSLYAIASGGMFGLGIGQSRQKSFLPEQHNDFIFAIICEELGFVGAALIIILFEILIWRGINIAIKAPDVFGSMIATGVTFMIATQVVINVAVVTNTMPNTGIPMPFISYGGTSLMVTMFLMGILLNISRYTKE